MCKRALCFKRTTTEGKKKGYLTQCFEFTEISPSIQMNIWTFIELILCYPYNRVKEQYLSYNQNY